MIIYLDANVFIYTALSEEEGKTSSKILNHVENGDIRAATSSLTLDEVVWVISKFRNKKIAISAAKDVLLMQNLRILSVTEDTIRSSLDIMEKYNLDPRDAIHSASALEHSIFSIVSSDSDFKNINEINYFNFEDLLKQV